MVHRYGRVVSWRGTWAAVERSVGAGPRITALTIWAVGIVRSAIEVLLMGRVEWSAQTRVSDRSSTVNLAANAGLQ